MLSNKFTKDTFENFSKTKVSSLKVFAPILLDSCEYDYSEHWGKKSTHVKRFTTLFQK